MKRIAVFVATTGGPVRVERITRERAPQSMVCLKRTSTILPISAAYDSFVRPGSGVIDRIFGPFEEGAFRLDVSTPIETGESWQLGFFVAHAICAAQGNGQLPAEDDADAIVWLTGHVDYDLAVGSVGHLAEKVHASRSAISGWLAAGRPVTMFVRDGSDLDAAIAAGVPDGVRVVAVNSARDALAALEIAVPVAQVTRPMDVLPANRVTRSQVPAAWLVGAFAATALAAVALTQWTPPAPPVQPVQKPNPPVPIVTAPPKQQASTEVAIPPVVKATPAAPAPSPAPIQATAQPPPAAESKNPATAPIAGAATKLAIFERRAPAGRTCAEVQFGAVPAVEQPAAVHGGTDPGLCGLAVAVDNGAERRFVVVTLDVIAGRLLYGTSRPDLLGGETAFGGRQEWPIDLPRRLSGPFEIKVTAISGSEAVATDAAWLQGQADETAAAKTLSAKGLALAVAHHRVTP